MNISAWSGRVLVSFKMESVHMDLRGMKGILLLASSISSCPLPPTTLLDIRIQAGDKYPFQPLTTLRMRIMRYYIRGLVAS